MYKLNLKNGAEMWSTWTAPEGYTGNGEGHALVLLMLVLLMPVLDQLCPCAGADHNICLPALQ
jgi:hypothetical protein